MIEDDFYFDVEHAQCKEGGKERADCKAYQIDESDGLANSIGFRSMPIPKVDYFHKNVNEVLLIELSDLNEALKAISGELAVIDQRGRIPTKDKKAARKKAFAPIVNEFQKKWCGSIAIIERLYRKNSTIEDPSFSLLIVLKNEITDTVIIDILLKYLEGMIKNINICRTKEVSLCLTKFNEGS